MFLTNFLFPGMMFVVGFVLNIIAVMYGTIHSVPIGTLIQVLLIWLFVSLPLAILGTILGRHWNGKSSFPCRVGTIPRPIPVSPWYTQRTVLIPLTGILPFGSIFIEMYFVFILLIVQSINSTVY
jgi:transmembrane 9 superfamily protein 3